MKNLLIAGGVLVCCVILLVHANADGRANGALFSWNHITHDFGTLKRNVPVSHKFTFVNKGTGPLLITSVEASCGCTVADYSREPIEAGGEGFVKATFNAASTGAFNKTVTVYANVDKSPVLLTIKGTVE